MKKLLVCLMALSFCIGATGCSSSVKTEEEVKAIFEDNNYSVTPLYENNRTAIWDEENVQGWMYLGSSDLLIYVNNDVNGSMFVDVENKTAINKHDGTIDDDANEEEVSELIESNKEDLAKLNLSNDEIKSYLKNEHKIEMEKYEKMSSKEKLKIKFPTDEDAINELSDEEAEKYFKYSEEKNTMSFSKLQEYAFFNDEKMPKDLVKYTKLFVDEMNDKNLHIENFKQLTKDDIFGVSYDLIADGNDTDFDLSFMYDLNKKSFIGISMHGKPSSSIDSNYLIAMCGMIAQTLDDSLSENEALTIPIKGVDEPVLKNGWIYGLEIKDDISFNILPYKK